MDPTILADLMKKIRRAACAGCHNFPPGKIFFVGEKVYCEPCRKSESFSSNVQLATSVNQIQEVPSCILDILDLLEFPCVNMKNGAGCTEMLSRKTMKDHLSTCKENLKFCSVLGFAGCDFLLNCTNINGLVDHLKENHGVKTLQLDKNKLRVVIPDWSVPFNNTSGEGGNVGLRQNAWAFIIKKKDENAYIFSGTAVDESLIFSMISLPSSHKANVATYLVVNPEFTKYLSFPYIQPVVEVLNSNILVDPTMAMLPVETLIGNKDLCLEVTFGDLRTAASPSTSSEATMDHD